MINFIIVDDNKHILNMVSNMIDKIMFKKNYEYNKYIFKDYGEKYKECTRNLQNEKIYILDIITNEGNGFEEALEINSKEPESKVIFISENKDEFQGTLVMHSYAFLGIIPKGATNIKSTLSNYIDIAIKSFNTGTFLTFKDSKNLYRIKIENITRIETNNRKTTIYSESNRTINTNLPLNYFEERLPNTFIKSHRACIINMEKFLSLNKPEKCIIFNDLSRTFLVSRKYIKEIEKYLSKAIHHSKIKS